MPRARHSIATRARHKKWIKRAKGYRGRRRKIFKLAKQAVLKAGQNAYRDRRKKKTAFRSLWHVRINAGTRSHGLSYSRFMHQLKAHDIQLNRKVLAQLAQEQPAMFKAVVDTIQDESAAAKPTKTPSK